MRMGFERTCSDRRPDAREYQPQKISGTRHFFRGCEGFPGRSSSLGRPRFEIHVEAFHLTLHALLNGNQKTAVGSSTFGMIIRFVPRCLEYRGALTKV
jgi:hypothetical protein